jgi:hypothetical protein
VGEGDEEALIVDFQKYLYQNLNINMRPFLLGKHRDAGDPKKSESRDSRARPRVKVKMESEKKTRKVSTREAKQKAFNWNTMWEMNWRSCFSDLKRVLHIKKNGRRFEEECLRPAAELSILSV